MVDIGILSVRDATYPPNQRLLEAAGRSGHRARLIHTRDCLSGIVSGRLGIEIRGGERPDVLVPRIGATINDYALGVVRHFELCGVPVVNRSTAIFLARHKFLSLQTLAAAGLPVPHTRFVVNADGFNEAVEDLGGCPVVVKMPSSRQGSGVARVDSSIFSDFIMGNLQDNSHGVIVQAYVPPEGRRDIRAFVMGGEVVGAMELRPRKGDFRSNIHLTGEGKTATLDRGLSSLAIRSAEALGLEIAGTDIVVTQDGTPYIVEVNYSPGFRGLEAATGLDIASRIIGVAVAKGAGSVCTSPF